MYIKVKSTSWVLLWEERYDYFARWSTLLMLSEDNLDTRLRKLCSGLVFEYTGIRCIEAAFWQAVGIAWSTDWYVHGSVIENRNEGNLLIAVSADGLRVVSINAKWIFPSKHDTMSVDTSPAFARFS